MSGKTCKVCGEIKPLESYRVDRLGVLGRQAKCKVCRNREEMESGLNTSEAFRKRQARNRKANLEKYRERENRWRRLNPEKIAAKNAARPPEPRDHQNARRAVRAAVKRGEIVRPDRCNRCSAVGRVYGHHHDYQKQLDVEWLCATCHRHEHLRIDAIASAIRSAGAEKTAESGHSPSTHNSESEFSDQTKAAIKEIDDNRRNAAIMAHTLVAGSLTSCRCASPMIKCDHTGCRLRYPLCWCRKDGRKRSLPFNEGA